MLLCNQFGFTCKFQKTVALINITLLGSQLGQLYVLSWSFIQETKNEVRQMESVIPKSTAKCMIKTECAKSSLLFIVA